MQQQEEWVVAFASVQGAGHVAEGVPCQDSCLLRPLENGWGIAVVADGAGSASHAEEGAELAVTTAAGVLEKAIYAHGWIQDDHLPTEEEWTETATDAFKEVYDELDSYAEKHELEINNLACTLMAVIYMPDGLLVAHIGDGRAGYSTEMGEWTPLMNPYKGEEANETVFLTSDIWENGEVGEIMECLVLAKPVRAFSVLTDGCEKASFECNLYDEEEERYYDPNRPYARFFEPNVRALLKLRQEEKTQEEINTLWEKFLTAGNDRFRYETDDKTMILAVNTALA